MGVHVTHERVLEEVPGLGRHVGADVEEHGGALEARQHGGDGGPIDAAQHAE